MAMMAKMRDLAPAFIITVGVLFVLFMVISDSRVAEWFGARSNNVGSVNGKEISYQEFAGYVDRYKENQKQQTGQDIDEENIDQFRDQVWDAVVSQFLTEQQIEKYNIKVTDQEIIDVIMGDNPPEFLKKSFIDSLGRFDRENYIRAISDPRNKKPLIQAEEVVKQQLVNQKLQSILFSSVNVSEGEIKRKFIEQNVKMNAEYVLLELNSIPDNEIKISEDEVKKYYNDNPDKFTVKSQRKLKYVNFRIQSSKSDSDAIYLNLQNVAQKLKVDTTDFKGIVGIYSEVPYSKDTNSINQLPSSVVEHLVNSKVGEIIGPIAFPGGYGIYRLAGIASSKETFIKASHILIPKTDDDKKDLALANDIYSKLINGGNFSELAKQNSKDPGSAVNGGDLGWFGKGRMVKEFEDACFKGNINEILKPVKTNYGYHIIKVTGKSSTKFVIEKITNSIKPSAATKQNIYNQANDFYYLSDKNGFEKEAELAKYQILETQPFEEESYVIPGIGYNKSLITFAFDNKLNAVSPAFKVSSGYVVVKISEIINEGVKKFEEVKNEAKALAIKQIKYQKLKEAIQNIKNKVGNNLKNCLQVNNKSKYDSTGIFTTAGNVPKVGMEYNLANTAYDMQLNQTSNPIKGERGYYLIKVFQRTNFDKTAYEMQKNSIRESILQEKKNSYFSLWLQRLKKDSDIVDNRYKFFGQ